MSWAGLSSTQWVSGNNLLNGTGNLNINDTSTPSV